VVDTVRPGENGLLLPPGDAGEFAAAITALLDDDARRHRMSVTARTDALQCAWTNVFDNLFRTYDEVSARVARVA
jgi:glycosyltransferase involved in cell wall biosynthesis